MLVRTNYINRDTLSSTLTNQFSKYVNGLLFTNAESDSMNGILNFNFGLPPATNYTVWNKQFGTGMEWTILN